MNNRKEFYPDFYRNFRCAASRCPDTCCRDWDIVVDDESFEFYSNVPGEFGRKLSDNIKVDEDGDRVFVLENKFCPFLTREWLCEIQIRLGEEHVCETCREFPRISQDYTEFTEYMLSLACPEACKMIIDSNNTFDFSNITEIQNDDNGYSKTFMNLLLKARTLTVGIFSDNTKPFKERLKACISFTEYVQTLIDDEIFDENKLCDYEYQEINDEKISRRFVFEMHEKLDIMDKNWIKYMLDSAELVLNDTYETDCEYKNMALYYIYRYYLNAIDSYDIITTVKRIYCAYTVCSAMTVGVGAEDSFDRRVMIIRKYSKEVEHSFENSDFLTDEFAFNPNFSSENIIKTL